MLLKLIKRLINRLIKAIKDIFRPKTGMSGWAHREIDIACRRERAGNNTPEGEWDYGCACYESALKAYMSLMKDGHSGWSIGMTKHILRE